jgi:hypothetical protein
VQGDVEHDVAVERELRVIPGGRPEGAELVVRDPTPSRGIPKKLVSSLPSSFSSWNSATA